MIHFVSIYTNKGVFMKQMNLYDYIEDDYIPSYDISKYKVKKINCETAKQYICEHHYSHGCHKSPYPCYALYDQEKLIGVLMFATPCGENVRASVFGEDYKDNVIELHRLHILDVTPKNTESWFIGQCIKLLLIDRPQTWAIISFSDTTQGHEGIIYKATNFMCCGQTGRRIFYLDAEGRLHHPRQNGVNISIEEAAKRNWHPVRRESKNRYILIIGKNKKEKRDHFLLYKNKCA